MFNYRNSLSIFALICILAGLAGCGGASGTKSDTTPIKTCGNFEIVLADGTCGAPPPLPPCEEGYIRATPTSPCVKSDFVPPTVPATVANDEAVIYFNKEDKKFAGYTLYTWQACSQTWLTPSPSWADESQTIQGVAPEAQDPIYGAYFIVKLKPGGTCGNFIVRTAGQTTQTADLKITTETTGSPFDRRYFIIGDPTDLHNSRVSALPICINDVCKPFVAPKLAISNVAAHWVNKTTIMWNRDVSNVKLYAANDGAKISANDDGSVAGGTVVAELSAASSAPAIPYLTNFKGYSLSLADDVIKALLKKELVIVGQESDGKLYGTRLQTADVLDALYTTENDDANEAKLGLTYASGNVTTSVWAPTAKNVELRIFDANLKLETTKSFTENKVTGVWNYTAPKAELDRKFYRFRVTVFNAMTNKTEVLEVTDPESVSLSTNGLYSQFVDLNDTDLKPTGWDSHTIPAATSPEAMSIYELHVRDFSVSDQSTPAAHRGKYLAFTDTNSAPVKHLKSLADAGLTHVHLLPMFDGSSVKEDPAKQINLDSYVFELCAVANSDLVCDGAEKNNVTLRSVFQKYAGDSDKQRKLLDVFKDLDGFNWGYDPEHFNAPDGALATDSKGPARILEARAMNMALHNLGLRVTYDMVYPHMAAAGVEAGNSTFDKIVPGYYFRQNIITGAVETATGAGPDTATEHAMMGKFVVDSLTQWAAQYKVDSFRFDQGGYMPKSLLVKALDAVKVVAPTTYFYGEGWTAGGSSSTRIAERASQKPLAGTGIGTFNDVLRNPLRQFALVNGGGLDAVRAGLAGNLTEFKLKTKSGSTIKASTVGAYNLDPQEAINYADVHDDSALWDWMQKPNVLPANTNVENRVRIQDLTLSVPILSQGVPFFHAGSELLRSKSMTSDSYNAGDWFNLIDYTKQTNNWMVGLPPKSDVSDADVLLAFADLQAKPTPVLIQKSSDVFTEFLKISKSSPLFSLTTAADVIDRVGFHDGGTTQKDNLIVMSIDDGVGKVNGTTTDRADLDSSVDAILVVFNGSASAVTQQVLTSSGFVLHSVLKSSVDEVVRTASFAEGTGGGSFTVPAYTTAVFVKPQAGAQGAGLSATATAGYEPPVPYGDNAIYIRGSVYDSGWSATPDNKMAYEGNSVYGGSLTIAAGSYEFKIADNNWSIADFGGAPVVFDAPQTLVRGGSNISVTIPATGNYRFVLNATNVNSPVLTVINADVFSAVPMYVRGDVFDSGWSATTTNKLVHQGNSVYDLAAPLAIAGKSSDYAFKIAADDWSKEAGANPADTLALVGTPKTLQTSGGQNIGLAIPVSAAGNYGFKVDARNTAAPVITVYKDDAYSATPLYVRGSVFDSGWSATDGNKFAYEGHGIYSVTLPVTANATPYEFKVADTSWTNATTFGSDGSSVVLDSPLSLVSPGNNIKLTISADGNYKFTLDTRTPSAQTITVKKVN
jgi:pullulanase